MNCLWNQTQYLAAVWLKTIKLKLSAGNHREAVGPDGISYDILKEIVDVLIELLMHVCQQSLSNKNDNSVTW